VEDRGQGVNKKIILECKVQKEDGYTWNAYFVAGWDRSKHGSKTQGFYKRHNHFFTSGGRTLLQAVGYYAQISPLPKSKSYLSNV